MTFYITLLIDVFSALVTFVKMMRKIIA